MAEKYQQQLGNVPSSHISIPWKKKERDIGLIPVHGAQTALFNSCDLMNIVNGLNPGIMS